jgi:hypothetical protein
MERRSDMNEAEWSETVARLNREFPDYSERARQYIAGELSEDEARKVEAECQHILDKAYGL